MARERVLAHADVAYPADGCASGSWHALENPWASIPIAVLHLVVMFANATEAVSSTMAGAPSCSSSRADSSSVTRGGVSRHRLGVLHDVALERREHRRLTPPGHLAGLGLVETLVVGVEVAEVEAPRAADQRGDRHVRERLQVGVELVPLLGLAAEPVGAGEHRPVVPHHLGRLGDVTEQLAAESLQHVPVQAGDLGLGNPWRAGHGRSSCRCDRHEDTARAPSVTVTGSEAVGRVGEARGHGLTPKAFA